jgi:hypothetical protein
MTPITIPSTVSELRNLFARKLDIAIATFSNVMPLEMVCIVVFQDELPNHEGAKNAKQNLKGNRGIELKEFGSPHSNAGEWMGVRGLPRCDRLLAFQYPASVLGLLERSLCAMPLISSCLLFALFASSRFTFGFSLSSLSKR